jgi:hypothetical protein
MSWRNEQERSALPARRRFLLLRRGCTAILFLAALPLSAQQPAQQPAQPVVAPPGATGAPTPDPGPSRPLTSSAPLAVPAQSGTQNFDAINAERKKEIASDSARLLKLATDLKAEVDKTDKDTLSISVIRKADKIEKLAHSVKDKMKVATGIN